MKKSPSTISSGLSSKTAFAKPEDVKVVATAEDYESDRATDQKRLEQRLQDLNDSLSQMEVQTPQPSPVLASPLTQNPEANLPVSKDTHTDMQQTSRTPTQNTCIPQNIQQNIVPVSNINIPPTQQTRNSQKRSPKINLVVPKQLATKAGNIASLNPQHHLTQKEPHQSGAQYVTRSDPQSMQHHSPPQPKHSNPQLVSLPAKQSLISPQSKLPHQTTMGIAYDPALEQGGHVSVNTQPRLPLLMTDSAHTGQQHHPSGRLPSVSALMGQTHSSRSSGLQVPITPGSGTKQYNRDLVDMDMDGDTDNSNIRLQCITGMKEYMDNSLEELRFEDYSTKWTCLLVYKNVFGFGTGPAVTQTSFGRNFYTSSYYFRQLPGTTAKFIPPPGQDTMVMNGFTQNISTKHQCISAMKEYEDWSLEELRFKDYFTRWNCRLENTTVVGCDTGQTTHTPNYDFRQLAGTTVKFIPPPGQDTMVKNGVTHTIDTKYQCISAMKEYEDWSLEELRVGDYIANRKVSSSKLYCDKCGSVHDEKDVGQCCDGHVLCKNCLEKAATVFQAGKFSCPVLLCSSIVPKSIIKKMLPNIIHKKPAEKWNNDWITNGEGKISVSAGSEGYEIVNLEETDREYESVSELFSYSIRGKKQHSYCVQRVFRVQNQRLWEKYKLTRTHMAEDLGETHLNERRLFHGTSYDVVPDICVEGFDWRLCGKNATAYGKGAYFARDASYSHDYSMKTIQQLKLGSDQHVNRGSYLMFLVKVLVGRVFKGDKSVTRPPKDQTGGKKKPLHTAVNDISDPAIYVIFDSSQSYPEYVIEYTEVK